MPTTLGFDVRKGSALRVVVDDEEMVADRVVVIDVAPREHGGAVFGDRRTSPRKRP